ncbi:transmembrane and immunoglobulin domain-containing protein 1 isoform X2 [Eucyclogobius newberryi]|uniref:transmembrane and immunoglobulin domain-containing protein 1 isoform X2 n=1 Tax=Eucyclogobius newberryi TaxID=166745 RepID=UPI003B5B7079
MITSYFTIFRFQTGVTIESTPVANSDGYIHTALEEIVSLTCKHNTTSEDDNELVWLRNDVQVSLNEGNKKGQSRVCISPVILEDRETTFTCHLRNNASDRHSVVLNVTHAPPLTDPEVVTVEEEASLILKCNIEAYPPVSSVVWKLNGTNVDLKASQLTLTNDGLFSTLTTEKVQRSLHEATYHCETESPLYGPQTKVFTVHVTDKTLKFPLYPMIAGIVVVSLTALLAVAARWRKIVKCVK